MANEKSLPELPWTRRPSSWRVGMDAIRRHQESRHHHTWTGPMMVGLQSNHLNVQCWLMTATIEKYYKQSVMRLPLMGPDGMSGRPSQPVTAVGSGICGLWICGQDGQNKHGAATDTDFHSNSGPSRPSVPYVSRQVQTSQPARPRGSQGT